MGEFNEREKPAPERVTAAKVAFAKRKYHLPEMCLLFNITDEHILLSGKKLSPEWDRKKLFGKERPADQETCYQITKIRDKLVSKKEELLPLYQKLILDNDYEGTIFHCLFIRYAREYFRK